MKSPGCVPLALAVAFAAAAFVGLISVFLGMAWGGWLGLAVVGGSVVVAVLFSWAWHRFAIAMRGGRR